MNRSTQKKELPIPTPELFERWKNGDRIKDIAKEYGVSYTVVRRILIEHNTKSYKDIAKIKKASRRKQISVPIPKLFELWKKGKSTRTLAKKYKVSRQTISRRLIDHSREEYLEVAKRKVIAKIAEIAKEKEISIPLHQLFKQWKNRESTETLAKEFDVSRQTISRRLIKHNKKQYQKIVKHRITTARTKELPIPLSELFWRWKDGDSPENLERDTGVDYRTILNKLMKYGRQKYKDIAEKRSGYGSIRARRLGADSLFELNVKRILEKHRIQSRKISLKIGRHNYRPDFQLLGDNTIIEAMGLNADSYWKRNKRKTRDYLNHKYRVIAVVPNEQSHQKATRYLSKNVTILRYDEFEEFVTTSLKKVSTRNAFFYLCQKLTRSDALNVILKYDQ